MKINLGVTFNALWMCRNCNELRADISIVSGDSQRICFRQAFWCFPSLFIFSV